MKANSKLDVGANRSARRAFTLMEVLLAIAMISLLAFIVVINVDKTMTSSQEKITESFVNNSLATPLMSFHRGGAKRSSQCPRICRGSMERSVCAQLAVRSMGQPISIQVSGAEEQGRLRCMVYGS